MVNDCACVVIHMNFEPVLDCILSRWSMESHENRIDGRRNPMKIGSLEFSRTID